MKPVRQRRKDLLYHLILANIRAGLSCPECGELSGHLYTDADTPGGACLSCKIDSDLQERDEAYADETTWVEDICTCGID